MPNDDDFLEINDNPNDMSDLDTPPASDDGEEKQEEEQGGDTIPTFPDL
jgi:hypothetical protein